MNHDDDDDIQSTDEPVEALNPIDARKAHYASLTEDAQKQLLAALSAYVTAVENQYRFLGWAEGVMEGWKLAADQFREQAEKERAARLADLPHELPTYTNVGSNSSWHYFQHDPASRVRTANDLVLVHIHEHPGQRGVEIAAAFDGQLPERTVRTALHRLKNSEKIKIVDGRWFPAEVATATPRNGRSMEANYEPA